MHTSDQVTKHGTSNSASNGTVRLNANIPADLYRALKVQAAQEGRTIGGLIREWVSGRTMAKT